MSMSNNQTADLTSSCFVSCFPGVLSQEDARPWKVWKEGHNKTSFVFGRKSGFYLEVIDMIGWVENLDTVVRGGPERAMVQAIAL